MSLLDDLRAALRSLTRRPGFAAVVALTLSVALGANTAVFSVLQQTVLRPVPHPGAEDAVYITREAPQGNLQVNPTFEQYRSWKRHAETLADMEAFDTRRVTLLGRGEPRRLVAAWITPGLFDFLGVAPALGRGFEPEPRGAARRAGTGVILSHALWRDLFGAPRSENLGEALGERIRLGEETFTVRGVMERGFRFVPPVEADVWLPLPADPERPIAPTILARMAPGVSRDAAAEELLALETHRMDGDAGADDRMVWTPRIQDLSVMIGRDLGRGVMILQAAVGLMLLIACANVGNLFLMRAEGRRREIAVVSALGAARARVVRTLLLESLLLAGAGALLGLAFARWAGGLITSLHGGRLLQLEALRLDPAVFAFTGLITVAATLAFGLLPAWTASRSDLGEILKRGSRGAGGPASGARVRSAMVVAEVALALVLVSVAGLLTKSFVGLVSADPGFEPDGLVTVSVALPEERYADEAKKLAFVRSLRERLETSGLDRTSLASAVPSAASLYFGRNLEVEGRGPLPEGLVDLVSYVAVDPGYFRTLGVPFVAGGPFGERGRRAGAGEEREIIVNRRLARVLWPDDNALGRRLKLGTSEDEPWSRVVGVVGDVAQLGLSSTHDTFQMYVPFRSSGRIGVLVRAGGIAPEAVGHRVATVVRSIDPWLPVPEARSAEQLLGRSVSEQRFEMALMQAFAGVALILTVLGVYAVLAYAVRRRAFEIGIRSALGARPEQVIRLVAGHGAVLIGVGLVVGLSASLALGRLVESQLHDVPARDPAVLAAAAGVLALAAACATLLPAVRAAKLDPARVLRDE